MPDEDDVPLIRVKSFAKIDNDIPQNDENGPNNGSMQIDVISLSSEEETKPIVRSRRRKQNQTPKPKKENTPRLPPSTGNRRFKTPLKGQYHKISEYFSSTKKDYKIEHSQIEPKSLNDLFEDEAMTNPKRKPTQKTEAQRLFADKRRAVILLRRLSIDQKVETKRTRDKHEDQSKLPDFIKYEPAGDSYYKTHPASTLPKGSMVQINSDLLKVEEEISIDNNLIRHTETECDHNLVTADNNELLLQPNETTLMSGITICDESDEDQQQNDCPQMKAEQNHNNNNNNNNNNMQLTRYNLRKKSKTPPMSKIIKKSIAKAPKPKAKQMAKQKKVIECPDYKIVEGTQFAVDAFRYGVIDGVEHYFLTHFHGDHYIGLKKSFNHTLYVSNITGRLVQEFIKVEAKYMKCLDISTPVVIDGVEVIAVDANHCPGAVMFIFKLPTGKCILHTGDFRASAEMEEYPEFWNNDIHTIYLDTTYLTSKYEFLTQSDSINELITQCHKFVNASLSSSGKPLIICGAYKVGKEKVWLRIAQEFDYKVWVDDERRKAMECIQNADILSVLTRYARDANIHILPLGNVSYQHIVKYMEQFEHFCKVLAIRPSGWEKNASKPSYKSRISMLGIQYSEHSNYNELERFVRFLHPENVISTVPFSNKNVAKTPKIPVAWLNRELKPKSTGQQRNIKDFLVKPSSKCDPSHAESNESYARCNEICPISIDQSILSSKNSDDFMF